MDKNQLFPPEKVKSMVDLGVRFDSMQSHFQESYLRKKLTKLSVLGIIKRNFIYMDEHTFILLYKSMVRPYVEFANSVWCAYT